MVTMDSRLPAKLVSRGRRYANRSARELRRARFIAQARAGAALTGCSIDLDIDRQADIGTDVFLELQQGSKVSIRIGRDARIQRGVIVRLWGEGRLDVGPETDLRYGVCMNIKGELVFEGGTAVGRCAGFHADGRMR